jgi:RNA polymerase sigma-70 factor, ECF subfamily
MNSRDLTSVQILVGYWGAPPQTYPLKGLAVTDRALIKACTKCQPGAWEEFIDRYSALVYHVIWKALRSETQTIGSATVEVEDICSEVFSQIIANNFKLMKSFEWRCKFSTWLGIITYRTTRQAIHRNRHAAFSLDDHNSGSDNDLLLKDIVQDHRAQAEENVELDEVRHMVHEALASLPTRDQLVLKFFYFEGKRYTEIARILGISSSLVGTAIFRAKLRLAQKLQHNFLPEQDR